MASFPAPLSTAVLQQAGRNDGCPNGGDDGHWHGVERVPGLGEEPRGSRVIRFAGAVAVIALPGRGTVDDADGVNVAGAWPRIAAYVKAARPDVELLAKVEGLARRGRYPLDKVLGYVGSSRVMGSRCVHRREDGVIGHVPHPLIGIGKFTLLDQVPASPSSTETVRNVPLVPVTSEKKLLASLGWALVSWRQRPVRTLMSL